MKAIAADVFLGLSAAVVIISCLGILVMRNVYDKVHYVTPVSLLAPVAVGIAIFIQAGWSSRSAQAWLAIGFMVIASPFLSHATIRAARIRETGDWRPGRGQDKGPCDGPAGDRS